MSLERLGLVPLTLLDYPGEVAATLFTHGCNLRCPYCHNASLVTGETPADFLSREELFAFLRKRARVLTGVCLTGGEPLLHRNLRDLILDVRELGYKVKLDTNGGFPSRLRALVEEGLLDYVAMDIKVAPERYGELGGGRDEPQRIRETIRFLADLDRQPAAGVRAPTVEFRTTVVPGLVEESDIRRIVELLPPGTRYRLAAFRGGSTLDPAYEDLASPPLETLEAFKAIADAAGLASSLRATGATAV